MDRRKILLIKIYTEKSYYLQFNTLWGFLWAKSFAELNFAFVSSHTSSQCKQAWFRFRSPNFLDQFGFQFTAPERDWSFPVMYSHTFSIISRSRYWAGQLRQFYSRILSYLFDWRHSSLALPTDTTHIMTSNLFCSFFFWTRSGLNPSSLFLQIRAFSSWPFIILVSWEKITRFQLSTVQILFLLHLASRFFWLT